MKKIILLLGTALLSLLFSSSNISQSNMNDEEKALPALKARNISLNSLQDQTTPSTESLSGDSSQPSYVEAYRDFLLHIDTYEGNCDFPIKGYYLMDFNFDQIPELLVYHDSGGSMGGYFHNYCFNENKITAIRNDQNEPAQISNYTQILADYENKKIYLLKEMYLLVGNVNGTYGYVRELINQGTTPWVHDILKLSVNEETNLLQYESNHDDEDKYLLDTELKDCLITEYYSDSGWTVIQPDQYYKLKRELIPLKNSFIDLRDTDVYFLGVIDDGTEEYKNIKMTEEEIDILFLKWLDSVE